MSNTKNVISFVKRRKANLIKVLGGKCCLCGFHAYQEALEFHHVNPEEKEFGITTQTTTKALINQLAELRKCVLVCANCHRGIHANFLSIPDNWTSLYDENIANMLLQQLHKQINTCSKCGIEITKNATMCVNCASKQSRVVERPTREQLKQLIRKQPFTQIGRDYHVTDNTIRKWCIGYNLPFKSREIKCFTDAEWEKI